MTELLTDNLVVVDQDSEILFSVPLVSPTSTPYEISVLPVTPRVTYTVSVKPNISATYNATLIPTPSLPTDPYKKISPGLRRIIEQSPDDDVGVIITLNYDYFTGDIQPVFFDNLVCGILCPLKESICELLTILFEYFGILSPAITDEGTVVTTIKAQNIIEMAKRDEIKYIEEDSGYSKQIQALVAGFKEERKNHVQSRPIDNSEKVIIVNNRLIDQPITLSDLDKYYLVNSNDRISVILLPNYTAIETTTFEPLLWEELNMCWDCWVNPKFKNCCICVFWGACGLYCWLIPQLSDEFSLDAVTADGYIIGTVPYGQILPMAQMNGIELIGLDFSNVAPTQTQRESIILYIGEKLIAHGKILTASYEPRKLFGISIPWTRSGEIRLDISFQEKRTTYLIQNNSNVVINDMKYTVLMKQNNLIYLIPT